MVTEAELARSELAQRLNELISLQELSTALAESLDVQNVVNSVADHVSRSVAADGTLVAVAKGGELPLRVVMARGGLSALAGQEIKERDAGLIGLAMGLEQIQVALAVEQQKPELVRGFQVGAAAVAPFCAHGVTVGALATVRHKAEPFSAEDQKQLATVAAHAAIVLENARLFELIRSGKEQWETTFDALADAVALLDHTNRVRRANRALGILAREPIPALIGRRFPGDVIGESAALCGYLESVRLSQAPSSTTTRAALPGGTRTLRCTGSALPQPDGDWLVILIEDVTEREALEAQLIQNEKMAAVGQLVSGVAHELNNPISSIAGLADFLRSKGSTPEGELNHIDVIHEQAERAAHIVRSLLSFARKGPAELTDVDLNEVIRSATALISHELKLRHIELELDLSEPLDAVRGDRHELQQVVLNLLTNAVQAVGDNPPDRARWVRAETTQRDQHIVITISDSGPGIPAELEPQIFLPFFTTKQAGEGTGLGLSITYRIVEGHKGQLSVTRPTDGASQFVVSLPVAGKDRPAAEMEAESEQHGAEPATRANAGNIRVLVVDDDPAVRQSLGLTLAGTAFHVQYAGDLTEARAMLRQHSYDIVILEPRTLSPDLPSLPADLFENWPELRSRTLLITGDVRLETEQWLARSQCPYLRKPVSAQALRTAVTTILQARASRS
jgi:two-component system NtrC family sensor kinase